MIPEEVANIADWLQENFDIEWGNEPGEREWFINAAYDMYLKFVRPLEEQLHNL